MNNRRRMTGFVTSDKMEKTVVVEVARTYRHRLYKKVVHIRKSFMAHDELGCKVGDHVRIVESRPISRHKRWVVEEILRHDIAASEPIVEIAADEPVAETAASETDVEA